MGEDLLKGLQEGKTVCVGEDFLMGLQEIGT